jgi:hypothetical protein
MGPGRAQNGTGAALAEAPGVAAEGSGAGGAADEVGGTDDAGGADEVGSTGEVGAATGGSGLDGRLVLASREQAHVAATIAANHHQCTSPK